MQCYAHFPLASVICTQQDGDGEHGSSGDGSVSSGSDSSSSLEAVGTGDRAPRPNPLLLLPVDRKPLFPGMVQGLHLTHPPTIEALVEMNAHGGNNYVGVFLRRAGEAGGYSGRESSEDPEQLQFPELITDPSQIYKTGTLAQVSGLWL